MTQELRELAEAATQGPWIAAGPSYGDPMPRYYNTVVTDRGDPIEDEDVCSDTMTSEDALFIAAANPAAILSLLDRLEKAEKDAARLDWLDNYAHIATWVDNEPTKLVIDAATGDEFTGDSWREAIDKAMEAK